MAHITLLSSVLSFFLITISADVQAIKVDEYHIDIQLQSDDIFYVACYVVFKNSRTTQEISMYTDYSVVRPIFVMKKDTDVNLDVGTIKHNSTTNILTLFLKEEIDPGLYVINITFARLFDLAFNQVYFNRMQEKEVMWLSLSHFQPILIQRIIPCWVRPKEDTSWLSMPTFNLSILHYAHHSVLTNMPIRDERWEVRRPVITRTYYDIIPHMSPYQLSIVVTNFIHINDEDDVISLWCRNRSASSLQFAFTIAKNITRYLHSNRVVTLMHWRFSTMRVKLIVIPKIQSYSNESFPERNDSLVHPGIVIANEDDIIYNEENDTVGRKYNVIRLLGYKLTQEYYKWIVNPYWEPSSTWLSKGFATFIATYMFNQVQTKFSFPNLRMVDLFVVQIQHECLDFDVDHSMLPFPHQNKTIPVEIIDNMKASVILRMLQHAFFSSSQEFWGAIDMFADDCILKNKELHLFNFWKTLNDVYHKTDPEKYNIKEMMQPWVEEKGYPVLTVIRNYNTSKSTMSISMENMNDPDEKRAIPLSYTTRTHLNFNRTKPYRWLNPPYEDSGYNADDVYFGSMQDIHKKHHTYGLKYKEDSWIIFNIQQTGYYRVYYDDENWARISKYLNGKDYGKIHVLNRAQLIDDAFHFTLLGELKADIFWHLAKYLERETDYIAWYPMFKAIEYMSTSFQFYKRLHLIKPKLDKMLDMLLRNINYEEQLTDNDFTKALRQEAVHWACSLKMFHCIHVANFLLRLHLKTHTKLSPWWKKWTYCYGLIEADNITWHQMLNKIEGYDNDILLYLITCPNYLVQIENYISTTYTYDGNNDKKYMKKSHITPSTMAKFKLRRFVYTIVESIKNDEEYNAENGDKKHMDTKFFKNLLDNVTDIIPRQLTFPTEIPIIFNNIYSSGHIYDAWCAFHKSIPEDYIQKKLLLRKKQINNHDRLFRRIEPRN